MDEIFKNNGGMVAQAFDGIKAISEIGIEYKDYFYLYDAEVVVSTYFKLGRCIAEAKWEKEYQDKAKEEASYAKVIDFDSIPEPTKITNTYDIQNGTISLEFSSKSMSEASVNTYKTFVACSLTEKGRNTDDSQALSMAIASFEENKEEILKEFSEISDSDSEFLPISFQKHVLSQASATKLSEKGVEQLKSFKPFVAFASENGVDVFMNSIKEGSKVYTIDEKGNKIEVSKASFDILNGGVRVEIEGGVIANVNPKELLVSARENTNE